jgi:transducin (beta)-like 1
VEVEAHWQEDEDVSSPCRAPFSLLKKHVCSSIPNPATSPSKQHTQSRDQGSAAQDRSPAVKYPNGTPTPTAAKRKPEETWNAAEISKGPRSNAETPANSLGTLSNPRGSER